MAEEAESLKMSPALTEAYQKLNPIRERVMTEYPERFRENADVPPENEIARLRYVTIPRDYTYERPLYYSLVNGKLYSAPDAEGSRKPDMSRKEEATEEEIIENMPKIIAAHELIEEQEA